LFWRRVMFRAACLSFLLLSVAAVGRPEPPAPPAAKVLFDFEDAADLEGWSNLELPDAKAKEPPVKLERVAEHATSGNHSVKLTFAGGRFPTVTTTQVVDDWLTYPTFEADVTVSRPCVVGFTVLQEKSVRGSAWEALISRWTHTAFLHAGTNHVVAAVPQPN